MWVGFPLLNSPIFLSYPSLSTSWRMKCPGIEWNYIGHCRIVCDGFSLYRVGNLVHWCCYSGFQSRHIPFHSSWRVKLYVAPKILHFEPSRINQIWYRAMSTRISFNSQSQICSRRNWGTDLSYSLSMRFHTCKST